MKVYINLCIYVCVCACVRACVHAFAFRFQAPKYYIDSLTVLEDCSICLALFQIDLFPDTIIYIFHISYILGGSPFSIEADFQGALHLTTNNKFHKQLKVKDVKIFELLI